MNEWMNGGKLELGNGEKGALIFTYNIFSM